MTDSTPATAAPLTCPACASPLQPMPKVGCHVGPDCTHGCLACGMHYTLDGDGLGATMTDNPTAADLARETPFTVDEWQHALNALGDKAAALLPTVKGYAARQHMTPYAAACAVLEAADGT